MFAGAVSTSASRLRLSSVWRRRAWRCASAVVSGSGTGCAVVANGRQPGFELGERGIGLHRIAASLRNVSDATQRDQVVGCGKKNGLQFGLRFVVLPKLEQCAAQREPRGYVARMSRQPVAGNANGF